MPGDMSDHIIREIAGLMTIIGQGPGNFNPRLKFKAFFSNNGIQTMKDLSKELTRR